MKKKNKLSNEIEFEKFVKAGGLQQQNEVFDNQFNSLSNQFDRSDEDRLMIKSPSDFSHNLCDYFDHLDNVDGEWESIPEQIIGNLSYKSINEL